MANDDLLDPADSSRLNRRAVVLAGAGGLAAAVGGTLLGPSEAPAEISPGDRPADERANPLSPSVAGTISSVDTDALTLTSVHPNDALATQKRAPAHNSTYVLKVSSDAELWRSGPAALKDFQPGDSIIAYVRDAGESLVAWAIEPMYASLNATVTSRSGDRLETDHGVIVIDKHTIMRTNRDRSSIASVADIHQGHRVGAACRLDTASGDYVAANIAVIG